MGRCEDCGKEVSQQEEHRFSMPVKQGSVTRFKKFVYCDDCCPRCDLPPPYSPEIRPEDDE